ncbi:MAG: B12-binding domain-containing protein [Phycisphaerae bacterium]
MELVSLFKQYLEHLFAGKRAQAWQLLVNAHDRGTPARKLLTLVIWPAMEQIQKLYREHHISRIVEHMATRINRTVADRLITVMASLPLQGKTMVVVCGEGEAEELGAQITADLFENDGWGVWFLGAGVPNDEILQFCGKNQPDILTIYGTRPEGVPGTRKLIEMIRAVGACEQMQVLVTGGVFNRADGLCDEVKADLYAETARDAVKTVAEHPVRVPRPDVPEPGRRRKRRNRKKKHLMNVEQMFSTRLTTTKITVEVPTEVDEEDEI